MGKTITTYAIEIPRITGHNQADVGVLIVCKLRAATCNGSNLIVSELWYWNNHIMCCTVRNTNQYVRATIARTLGINVNDLIESAWNPSNWDYTDDDNVVLYGINLHRTDALENLRNELVFHEYTKIVKHRSNATIDRLNNNINELQSRAEQLQRTLVSYHRELIDYRKKREECARNQEVAIDTIQKEFDRILLMPGICKLDIGDNGWLCAYTNMVSVDHLYETYDIGKFRIEIADTTIRFTNLNVNSNTLCHHPHVSESGSPCFGSWGDIIHPALAGKCIDAVIDFCLQFLHSYTYNDAFCPIQAWGPNYDSDVDYRYHDGVELGDIEPSDDYDDEDEDDYSDDYDSDREDDEEDQRENLEEGEEEQEEQEDTVSTEHPILERSF